MKMKWYEYDGVRNFRDSGAIEFSREGVVWVTLSSLRAVRLWPGDSLDLVSQTPFFDRLGWHWSPE